MQVEKERAKRISRATERPREFISFNWGRSRQQLEILFSLFHVYSRSSNSVTSQVLILVYPPLCDNNNTYSLFQKLTSGFLHPPQMQSQKERWGENPLHSLQLTGNGLTAYLFLSLPRRRYRPHSRRICPVLKVAYLRTASVLLRNFTFRRE